MELIFEKKTIKNGDKCARCGACLSFCPVYKLKPIERFSPRGKNYLIHNLLFEDKEKLLRETISACLQCGACSKRCSSGTDVAALIRQVRKEIKYYQTIPQGVFEIWKQVGDRNIIKALKYAKYIIPSLKKELSIAEADLFQEPSENSPLPSKRLSLIPKKEIRKVIFFPGCSQKLLFKDKPKKVMALLENFETEMLTDSHCCGLPAYSQGAFKQALFFIRKNLMVLKDMDFSALITGCASCAYMIKNWHKILPQDDPLSSYAEKISQKSFELTAFLQDFFSLKPKENIMNKRKIMVQIPCHLRYGLNNEKTLIEFAKKMTDEHLYLGSLDCCGLGGTFSITNPRISKDIFKANITDKINNMNDCPDIIVTNCSGCLYRLKNGLKEKRKQDIKIYHIIDLFFEQ